MMKEHYKHPRLYLKDSLQEKVHVGVSPEQSHYLKTVLRKTVGDIVRVFNGRDGEWLSRIVSLEKKGGVLEVYENIRLQPSAGRIVHLYFAPIKKQRMDILMEKAVELGVNHFHPVITHRTENRKLSMERLSTLIFEAAEQCERLEIPTLHEAITLPLLLRGKSNPPLFACLERGAIQPLSGCDFPDEFGFLIGPEGGFDDEEVSMIQSANLHIVSLGEAVLRAETASISCLAYVMLSKQA